MMIWIFLVISVGLVSAKRHAEPEYLNKLRDENNDQEFAELLGLDVKLVRAREDRSDRHPMMNEALRFGDIVLSKEQEEKARQGMRFDKYPEYKWPNNQIPYEIRSKDYNTDQVGIIENAIADWNKQIKNLKIVKRSTRRPQKDYVYVFSGDGCYSAMGKEGDQQGLSLESDGCVDRATVQHEFMHAAGFTHEQNRSDRDKYIKMLWDNIPKKWRDQYDKVSSEEYGNQGPYDYYSVMHYTVDAPDTDGDPAFEVLQSGIDEDKIGNGETFTKGDIDKLNVVYP